MVSNSNFQCIQILTLLQFTNLQTPKLSKFENVKHSNSVSLKLSIFRTLKMSIFQPSKLETFRTFKLWTVLEPGGCSVNLVQRVATASNFQAGFPFKLSNSKLAPTFKLGTLKLWNFKLFILQTFQFFKLSNLVQHIVRSNSQKFEFEKTPLVTPLRIRVSVPTGFFFWEVRHWRSVSHGVYSRQRLSFIHGLWPWWDL